MRALLTIAACALAVLTGCNKSDESTANAPAAGTTAQGTIGVSLLTLDNPFFKVIGDNITAEGKKRGSSAIVVSGDKDVAKHGRQIKDFIVKKVSDIVLSRTIPSDNLPKESRAAEELIFKK